jgi:hypothetical protein
MQQDTAYVLDWFCRLTDGYARIYDGLMSLV